MTPYKHTINFADLLIKNHENQLSAIAHFKLNLVIEYLLS